MRNHGVESGYLQGCKVASWMWDNPWPRLASAQSIIHWEGLPSAGPAVGCSSSRYDSHYEKAGLFTTGSLTSQAPTIWSPMKRDICGLPFRPVNQHDNQPAGSLYHSYWLDIQPISIAANYTYYTYILFYQVNDDNPRCRAVPIILKILAMSIVYQGVSSCHIR